MKNYSRNLFPIIRENQFPSTKDSTKKRSFGTGLIWQIVVPSLITRINAALRLLLADTSSNDESFNFIPSF